MLQIVKLSGIMNALEIFESFIKENAMKNLKKFLVLLTLVAVIVSSVAVIALAEGETYTGTIAEAETLLAAVDTAADMASKSKALAAVYQYIEVNKLSAAPGYAEFEKKMHNKSLALLTVMTDEAFSISADNSYYSYIVALEVIKSFDSFPKLTYTPSVNGVYTGTLETPVAQLATISEGDTYDVFLAKMAGVYSYLVTNPVNPMVDGYLEFITKYDEKAAQLANAIEAAVGSVEEVDAKIGIMQAVYRVLAGVEDGENSVAPAPISMAVVSKYNAVRQSLIDEYDNISELLEDEVVIEGASAPTAITDLTEFNEWLGKLEDAVAEDPIRVVFTGNLAAKAFVILAENAIDPAADGYAASIARYKAAIDAFSSKYEQLIEEKTTLQEKIDSLSSWYSSLNQSPFSEGMVEDYNRARSSLIAECEEIINICKSELPAYVAVEKPVATVSVGALNYNLKGLWTAYDKYEAAAAENKAAALAELKSGVEAMYEYLELVVVNPEAEGYYDFVVSYDEVRAAFVSALLESVDEAAELEALSAYFDKYPLAGSSVSIYNDKVDEIITADAQKASALKKTTVYYEIHEAYEAFSAAEAALAYAIADARPELYTDYVNKFKAFYGYHATELDVTDITYFEYIWAHNEAVGSVLTGIEKSFADAGNAFDLCNAALKDAHELLLAVPFSESAIELVTAKFAEVAADYANNLTDVTPVVDNAYTVLEGLMNQYRAAEGIEAQMVAFKALYDGYLELDATRMTGIKEIEPSYEAFVVAYAAVCDGFAQSLQSYLTAELAGTPEQKYDALVLVGNYLENVKFSNDAISFYNEKRAAVKTQQDAFKADRDKITNEITVLEYVAADDVNGDVDSIFENDGNRLNLETVNELYGEICELYDELALFSAENPVLEKEIPLLKKEVDALQKVVDDLVKEIEELNAAATPDTKKIKAKQETLDAESATLNEKKALYNQKAATFEYNKATIPENEAKIDVNREILKTLYRNAYVAIAAGPYDFAHSNYKELIIGLNAAEPAITDSNSRYITYITSVDERTEQLKNLYDYIVSIAGAASPAIMIEAYNGSRDELLEMHVVAAISEWAYFQASYRAIEDFLKSYPIAKAENTVAIESFNTKLAAMRYAYVEGAIITYNNARGDHAVIHKLSAIDQLNYFNNNFSLNSQYTESALADLVAIPLYTSPFSSLLNKIEAIEDEAQKTEAIASLKEAIINNSFPTNLVNSFKSRFGIEEEITPNAFSGQTAVGSIGGFLAAVKACQSVIKAEDATIADIQAACVELINYINANPFNTTNTSAALNEQAEQIVSTRAAIKNEQMKLADSKAPLSEYSLGYVNDTSNKLVNHNFDAGTAKKYPDWKYAKLAKINGNSCVEVFEGENTLSAARYKDITTNNTGSIVVELDILSNENLDFVFKFFNAANNIRDSKGAVPMMTTYMVYFDDGKLCFGSEISGEQDYSNYRKGIDAPIYAVPGQWMHIACVVDVENKTQELLINHVSLGTRPLTSYDSSLGAYDDCYFKNLRLNETRKTWKVYYDNLKIYSGTSYRIMDKYSTADSDESFMEFVDYMCDENNYLGDRMFAYNEAVSLRETITNKVPQEYKDRLESFDYRNELYIPAQDIYLSHIEEVIQSLKADGINSVNLASQQTILDSLEEYILLNTRYIDQTTERFVAARAELNILGSSAARINSLNSLIESLKLFKRATTSVAMQKYYENSKSYYDACEFEIEENLISAEQDPAVLVFLSGVPAEYRTLYKYYNEYIDVCIAEKIKEENSQKIIDCVDIIKTIVAEQDRANLAAVKEAATKNQANIDFVNTYILVIRDIVDADNYDAAYDGIDDAMAVYDALNETFYDLLMESHYTVIKAQLDKYPLTEAYIGRAGICKYIENYIEINKVDMDSETGRQYLYLLDVYKAELDIYRNDFVAVLEANTKAFIETVNKMSSYVKYKDLKPLYDEAIEKYYYNMNVDAPETQAAIAQFEIYEEKLNKIEENSAMFIGYAKTLATATRKAQVYRALVNCGMYVDGVDDTVEGVSSALNTYETKLAAYNEEITKVNGDVSNAVDVVCSVRSNSIAATVLAVVKKLFNN